MEPSHVETRDGSVRPTSIEVVEVGPREIVVRLDDTEVRCNRFWLRDNAPANGDRASLFRPFSVASMSDDLTIVAASADRDGVLVTFSDGFGDRFSADLLRACEPGRSNLDVAWTSWGSGHEPDVVEYEPTLADGPAHHALLDALRRDGFARVTGVPPEGTDTIASWLGPIRETDFGRVFDIVTDPDPFTPSQSDAALDPHTDDPYRYAPPGISVLHCLSPCDGVGGASVIVDGFAVAESIARDDPAAFELLTTLHVPYVHRRAESVEQGLAVHLRADAPIIATDESGRVCGIRFHERSMATLQLDRARVDDFYRALMLFSRRVNGGEFAWSHRLEAGEAIVYDNQRVLHGRSAIEGGRRRRHLRLFTVDRDQVHSGFRRLCETFAPGSEERPLPAGSGS